MPGARGFNFYRCVSACYDGHVLRLLFNARKRKSNGPIGDKPLVCDFIHDTGADAIYMRHFKRKCQISLCYLAHVFACNDAAVETIGLQQTTLDK